MSLRTDILAYCTERTAVDWSPRTAAGRRWSLLQVADWLAKRGHRRWATVSGTDLDGFLLHLADRGQRRSTIDTSVAALRTFGAWLAGRGRVLRNPALLLHCTPAGEEPLPRAPLSEEQVAAIFAAIPRRNVVDLRNRLHVEMLYSCALRNAKAAHLDVADLDLDTRCVHVREGKMGKDRLLPLLASTLAAASDYLSLRRDLLRGPDHGALFLNPQGRRLPAPYMQFWLSALGRRLGFHVHSHLLRHSIAVHLLRRGADVRHIQ